VSLPQTISDPSPHVSRELPADAAVHDPPLTRIAPELLRNVKVLVVDDNADGRDVIARILREAGAEVLLASSATAALDLFARDRPDVLLSDIGMPDIDGYELIRRIRTQGSGQTHALPAAALTALARPEDRTRALLAGYQTHIAKPVDATELIAAVAALAGRTGVA
jgi:CheY-like chemotaxis protein